MESVILALIEGFADVQPDVSPNYTGSGSGAGIEGVLDGTCDLGLASRALSDEEKEQGAVENIIALDGRRGRDKPREHRDRPDHRADCEDFHR